MEKKKRELGLTQKQMCKRIMNRTDNVYSYEVIKNVIDMYFDESVNAIKNGEKIVLSGIGTLNPKICNPVRYNIFDENNDAKFLPHVRLQFTFNRRLKEWMNSKYRANISKGFAGISEFCKANAQQITTLVNKGLIKREDIKTYDEIHK